MKISELIPLFDDALKNKNETSLFLIEQKIARKYSYNYYKKVNIKYDYELIADEITCNLLRVAKETDWQEEPRYSVVSPSIFRRSPGLLFWICINTELMLFLLVAVSLLNLIEFLI